MADKTSRAGLVFIEIFAVLLTAIGKILFMNVWDFRLPYILVVLVFWTGYVIWKRTRNPKAYQYWGLHLRQFRSTFLELLPWALILIGGFGIYGMLSGKMLLSLHMIPIFLLYPVWGILQQFLVLSLFGQNLKQKFEKRWSVEVLVVLTAVLFGLVHYPFALLIVGTFFLALVYTILFFKGRNLIALGIYHGWLATFFFYWVLGRDSWLEAFG